MIVSYNFYYARPGSAAAVLQQRIKASDIRAQLGLPRGRIISKLEGDDDWPDVIWRLDFTDMAAQDADMQARAASAEFETIRQGMRRLYRRFERPLYAPFSRNPASSGHGSQQTMLLYGLYYDASASPVPGTALDGIEVAEFISGSADVPRLLCETGQAGLPQDMLDYLGRLPLRIERSVWSMADEG
jgi:hypothetical protein